MHLHIISRADAKRAGLKYYFTGKPCKHGHFSERKTKEGKCFECERDHSKARKITDRDRQRAFIRDWESRNKDKCAAMKRAWWEKNKHKNKEWKAANPEKLRAYNAKRRAMKLNADGSHTSDDIFAMLEKQKSKCVNCKCDISKKYHVDHVMPLSLGGSDGPDNLQLLCPTCNIKKAAKHPIDWAQENGRLL